MGERAEIVRQLDQARERMRSVLADVDTQIEIYPGWTIKDVLAHIAGWDDATCASLRAHAAGDVPATPAIRGIDYYNAQTVAERKALSYAHVLKEWEQTREELKTLISGMSVECLERALVLPWGQTGTVAQVVAIFVHHEEEHAREIRRIVRLGRPE
jgi:hypothetical protein